MFHRFCSVKKVEKHCCTGLPGLPGLSIGSFKKGDVKTKSSQVFPYSQLNCTLFYQVKYNEEIIYYNNQ